MAEQHFSLTSPAFGHGAMIPAEYTCDGRNAAIPLEWIHPPQETRSFVLVMDDPDAPNGTFTHWVLANVPADTNRLDEHSAPGVAGKNGFQHAGYGGPCPPANHGKHRYFFRLYALDVDSLDVNSGAPRDQVEQAMEGHVLDSAELMGLYQR